MNGSCFVLLYSYYTFQHDITAKLQVPLFHFDNQEKCSGKSDRDSDKQTDTHRDRQIDRQTDTDHTWKLTANNFVVIASQLLVLVRRLQNTELYLYVLLGTAPETTSNTSFKISITHGFYYLSGILNIVSQGAFTSRKTVFYPWKTAPFPITKTQMCPLVDSEGASLRFQVFLFNVQFIFRNVAVLLNRPTRNPGSASGVCMYAQLLWLIFHWTTGKINFFISFAGGGLLIWITDIFGSVISLSIMDIDVG